MPIKEGTFQPQGFETAGIDFNQGFYRFARGTFHRDFDQRALAPEGDGNHHCFRRRDIGLGREQSRPLRRIIELDHELREKTESENAIERLTDKRLERVERR